MKGGGDYRELSNGAIEDEEKPVITTQKDQNAVRTESDAKADRGSVIFVLVSNFTLAIQYSLLMPTVWKYVHTEMGGNYIMFGAVLAAFTIAQVFLMPIIGKIGDRIGMKGLYAICYSLAAIGSFLYGIAGKIGSPWVCLGARFVAGLGASANVLNTACVSKWSRPEDLNRNMNIYLSVRMIGNIIGPAFCILLANIHVEMFGGVILVTDTTSAGYIMVIPNLLLLVMSVLLFNEPTSRPRRSDPARNVSSSALIADAPAANASTHTSSSSERGIVRTVLFDRGGWFCLLLQFTGCCGIGAMETAVTPITAKLKWSKAENSILFIVISLVIFAAIAFSLLIARCDKDTTVARRRRPRRLVAIGMLVGLVSLLFLAAYELIFGAIQSWSLFVYALLAGFPIPLLIGPTNAIYASKLESGSKGQFMSYVGISQALGRSLGPLVGSLAVMTSARHFWPIAVVSFITWVVPPLNLKSLWSRLEVDVPDAPDAFDVQHKTRMEKMEEQEDDDVAS